VPGKVVKYSALLDAHQVAYEDGDERWERELWAGDTSGAASLEGASTSTGDAAASTSVLNEGGDLDGLRQSPFARAYVSPHATDDPMEHTHRLGIPMVPPAPLHRALATFGFGLTAAAASDVAWRSQPVGFLESLHPEDLEYFNSMAGSLAQDVEGLVERCMAAVRQSEAPSPVVGCKLHAVFGNALFVYHNTQGDKTGGRLQVAIFETSTVPILQTKTALLCHGMPKSENAFGIRTYGPKQAQSLATLTPKELQHDVSMFGLATTVLTRSLLRKLATMELPQLSLCKLSRRCLARLVQHTFLSASHDVQALTFNLSALLAFGHDKEESSPIVGTCLENVYSFNGWHKNTARSATQRVRKGATQDNVTYPIVPHNARTHTHLPSHGL